MPLFLDLPGQCVRWPPVQKTTALARVTILHKMICVNIFFKSIYTYNLVLCCLVLKAKFQLGTSKTQAKEKLLLFPFNFSRKHAKV